MERLPHVDRLVDETRGARFFTELGLAMSYMQFRIRKASKDRFKASFRLPGGQHEFTWAQPSSRLGASTRSTRR